MSPEIRRVYRISGSDPEELNRVLADLADRLDQLEGYRGKGDFKTIPSSSEAASTSTDLARYGQIVTITQIDSRITSTLADVTITISCNTLKAYAQDSPTTILHGFGNVGPGVT